MPEKYVVVGAGPVGTELSRLLADQGQAVTVVTRSGGESAGPVTRVAADASDPARLTELATGAKALFNCANPGDYTTWERVWPPLSASLLTAAERTGATLVITGNLYPYGPTDSPMIEGQADSATDHKGRLRARMWAEALDRHRAGRLHVVEVRGSDYLGPRVGSNGHISRHVASARRGKAAQVIGRPDLPHTWTDVGDMARALAVVADRDDSWGQVWHAPSNDPRTQREALTDVLAAGGHPPVTVRGTPDWMLAAAGLFSPLVREFARDVVHVPPSVCRGLHPHARVPRIGAHPVARCLPTNPRRQLVLTPGSSSGPAPPRRRLAAFSSVTIRPGSPPSSALRAIHLNDAGPRRTSGRKH